MRYLDIPKGLGFWSSSLLCGTLFTSARSYRALSVSHIDPSEVDGIFRGLLWNLQKNALDLDACLHHLVLHSNCEKTERDFPAVCIHDKSMLEPLASDLSFPFPFDSLLHVHELSLLSDFSETKENMERMCNSFHW